MSEKQITVNSRVARTLIALAIFTTAILLTGCSNARGRVEKVSAEGDVMIVDGEPDYGIKVTVIVKNVGESGSLRITARLSCSEGEWERTRNLHFNANEAKTLTYSFHEPTINATDIYYGANVFPSADKE